MYFQYYFIFPNKNDFLLEESMKKIFSFCILLCVLHLCASCFTAESSRRDTAQISVPDKLLDPDDVVGKNLIGSDNSGTYKFLLHEDGSLEYTKNNILNYGKWSFNNESIIYRYTFHWTENGTETGYIMDFFVDTDFTEKSEIHLWGQWLYGYYPFRRVLRFE